jgi:hypothetical protein
MGEVDPLPLLQDFGAVEKQLLEVLGHGAGVEARILGQQAEGLVQSTRALGAVGNVVSNEADRRIMAADIVP